MYGIIFITIKQLLGERLHRSLFFLGLFTLLGIPVVTQLSMFDVDKALLLYSMNVITFLGVLFAIFSVYILVSRDIGEKRIYYVLSMPISRASYLVGRFSGVIFTGFLLIVFLIILFVPFILFYTGGSVHMVWLLLAHGFFAYLEMLMLVAVSLVFFPLFDSPTVFVFVVSGIYIAGANMRDAKEFIMQSYEKVPAFSRWIINTVYYILPNFSAFDWKMPLVYSHVKESIALLLFLYAIFYAFVSLCIAALMFNKRELL